MMLYLIPALFVIVCSVLASRYFLTKTRLSEKAIDEAIARKLPTSPMQIELTRLQEQNAVMRNLLLDMVENEASVAGMDMAERTHALNARAQRRREIFGEAVFVLQQNGVPQALSRNLKIHG